MEPNEQERLIVDRLVDHVFGDTGPTGNQTTRSWQMITCPRLNRRKEANLRIQRPTMPLQPTDN